MSKLVSIIVPAYNVARYLGQTLDSVLNQTYQNWECLVIDDGSTDETAAIGGSYAIKDARIKVYTKQNGGLCSTRNFGMSVCNGDFIQFLDGDDLLFEQKLELMVEAMEAEQGKRSKLIPFCDYIYGNQHDPYSQDKGHFKLFRDFAAPLKFCFDDIYAGWDHSITIPIHCFLFSKESIGNILFDTELKSKEDWSFHLALLHKGFCFVPFNYLGCSYRVTGNSMSKNLTELIVSSIRVLKKWKKARWTYLKRVSYYVLQSYIYKLSGRKINMTAVMREIYSDKVNSVPVVVLGHLLLPYAGVFKIFNIIRIRF